MAHVSFNHGTHHGAIGHARPHGHIAGPIDATSGPGWYESSWDLQRGLDVHEGLPGDAKLHEWLEHHLRN
jgi:hypothetical protein